MEKTDEIVCKPTRWFTFRAGVMLAMFSVFAVLFYIDGSTGYRKKNEVFYLYQTFQKASDEFSKMNADGTLTPEAWEAHAAEQTVAFPEDASILPAGQDLNQPWPEELRDFEQMKSLQWRLLWREFSLREGLDASPPEKSFDAGKIREQWIVFWICLALVLATLFFLIRTLRRTISADAEAVTAQTGVRVPYGDLKRLDLRKWDSKGIALAEYSGASGSGVLRIDGLTYGGFKKDQGEPAEQLMQRIRANFTGEIIEYTDVDPAPAEDPTPAVEAAPEDRPG